LVAGYCAAVERARSAGDRLAQVGTELDAEVASFAAMLEAGEGPVRLDGDCLVVGCVLSPAGLPLAGVRVANTAQAEPGDGLH